MCSTEIDPGQDENSFERFKGNSRENSRNLNKNSMKIEV